MPLRVGARFKLGLRVRTPDKQINPLVCSPGPIASRRATRTVTLVRAAESAHSSRQLLRGAYSLLANTAVTSVLGMGFWVSAARLYSSVEVGRDTVLISVMIELSTVCQLNMGNGIVRFLPDFGQHSARALGGVYGLTATVALVVGTVFVRSLPTSRTNWPTSATDALRCGFVGHSRCGGSSPCRMPR